MKRFRKRISRSSWFIRALSGVVALAVSAMASTLRFEWTQHTDSSLADDRAEGWVYAFWHGRISLLVPAFRDRGIVIMTSTSFAGEVITRIIERFGYATVRGSSRRRGTAALIAAKGALRDGRDVGVALDGPSGPNRKAKGGALAAARSSGSSIVPIGVSASPAWVVPRTWDHFMVPVLFARCVVVVGRPIPSAEVATMRLEDLDRAVDAVTDEADRRAGLRTCRRADRTTDERA